MASISASTTHKTKKTKAPSSKPKAAGIGIGRPAGGKKASSKASTKGKLSKTGASRRSLAPKTRPATLVRPEQISELKGLDGAALSERVSGLVHRALGMRSPFADGIAKPHTASTTADRSGAAADLAVACRELGVVQVLKTMGALAEVESMLLPEGIGAVFANSGGTGGMKRIASTASMGSLGALSGAEDTGAGTGTGTGDTTASLASGGSFTGVTDSKRGKSTPPDGREGALLVLRALCEIVGRASEPFVVPFLAAAVDESSSSSGSVREAAEDTASAIVTLANPLAVPGVICPVLFEALKSPEWRVKVNALERLAQCSTTAPRQIGSLLPRIVPVLSSEVWDTKAQVTKASKDALLACCRTNANPDVAPAIPAVVNAICKPADTMKAVDELKGTTFVAPVDGSTLSILCPILSRGLKEKAALSKRSCCVVIENMCRLVDSPSSAAPFGPLLVPELKKVAENVAFEDIRDAALAALKALTKALGHASVDDAVSAVMADESARVEEEQRRIEEEREAERRKEEENRVREEEERRKFKEAMEAQRQLERLAAKEEEEKKAEEQKKREKQKKSTKSAGGKCQGCGLKKCKKTCLFYSG